MNQPTSTDKLAEARSLAFNEELSQRWLTRELWKVVQAQRLIIEELEEKQVQTTWIFERIEALEEAAFKPKPAPVRSRRQPERQGH